MANKKISDNPRQYKPSTVRRLDILSGNECANPTCDNKLIAEDGISIISKICHIAAASKGGPRYDDNMTDDERRAYENLILLCDEHHVIIDNKENEAIYTVDLLKKWKSDHEKKTLESIAGKDLLSKQPLALNKVINAIASNIDNVIDLPETMTAPNTEDKINFNNIKRYEPIIREFAAYQTKLNKIYEVIEKEGSAKKAIILLGIQRVYMDVSKAYDDVKSNSDAIIDDIIDSLTDKVYKAPNKPNGLDQETIDFSLMIIIVDAFMRCNILEEPPKQV